MAKRKIKLLSTVALNEDLPRHKLKRGQGHQVNSGRAQCA